jgi:hypothetical protein
MRPRIVAVGIACVLGALAWVLPQVRGRLLYDIGHWDAVPRDPPPLPGGPAGAASGLAPVPRTRVVVLDGLSADVAAQLPALQRLCARGVALQVDVGFPTVFGVRRTTLTRVVVSELALLLAATAAALTASGAWGAVFGAEVAPVVPRFTAYLSPLLLLASHGAAAVALGAVAPLARSLLRRAPPTPRAPA